MGYTLAYWLLWIKPGVHFFSFSERLAALHQISDI